MSPPRTLLQRLGDLIDRAPMVWVAGLAIWLAVAPIVPEPHLVDKWRMLSQGTLTRPLDVFDLLLHTVPLLVLLAKLVRARTRTRTRQADPPDVPPP
jgi:formate hydrogenlyase subunit 3/multisubunit Na+/H+ antiporter MnhD subunit